MDKMTIGKIIDTAVMRCGVSTSGITPEILLRAKESIRLVLLDMLNKGLPIFMLKKRLFGFEPNKWKYNVDPSIYDITNLVWRQYSHPSADVYGGNNPNAVQDMQWDTYCKTEDYIVLDFLANQIDNGYTPTPMYVGYFGVNFKGDQLVDFSVQVAQEYQSNNQWNITNIPNNSGLSYIARGDGLSLCGLSGNTTAYYSDDYGQTWYATTIPSNNKIYCGIVVNNTIYLITDVGLFSTQDYTAWSINSLPSLQYGSIATDGVNLLVTTINNNVLLRISLVDLTNYTITLPNKGVWTGVAYNNGIYVINSYNTSLVLSSIDLATWTTSYLPEAVMNSNISVFNNMFITNNSNSSHAYSSVDGITWNIIYLPTKGLWSGIATGNNLIVLIQNNSNIAIQSSDLINWETQDLGITNNWVNISYDGELGGGSFVAISGAGSVSALSFDGYIKWQTVYNYTGVVYDGQWIWEDLETPIYAGVVRLVCNNNTVLTTRGFFAGSNNNIFEVVVGKQNRDQFLAYPNKGITGVPLNYFFYRDVIPQIQIWQSPTENNAFMWCYNGYVIEMPDMDVIMPLPLNIPEWYIECIIWNLANKLIYVIPGADMQRVQLIDQKAIQSYKDANNSNGDTSSINLLGNVVKGYTR